MDNLKPEGDVVIERYVETYRPLDYSNLNELQLAVQGGGWGETIL
jgi:hypothetical protein